MTTLSVVIPAFNEENGILDVVRRVLAIRPALAEAGVDGLELIVVDDGSADRTAELVSAEPGVRLIRHPRNRGYGGALKTGFATSVGEWIGFLDADGTYPPESFPDLCRVALVSDADIVIGSRMAGAESHMPAVRRLGNLLFASLVSLVSAQRISDSASGMRVFRRGVLERVYPLPNGLNLTPVMSTRALHEGLKMVETPIPYAERAGRSKLSVVRDGVRFAQSIVWTALSYNPVQSLGLLGAGALGLATLIGLGVVAARLQGITTLEAPGVFAVFTALVLSVVGISLLALGASFNYFVALFHKRPVRQGLFGHYRFPRRLDRLFAWAGLGALLAGILLGVASLLLGLGGMPVGRLWFYYLASASASLVGIQMLISWVQMQVLEALSIRDALVAEDLLGSGHPGQSDADEPASTLPVAG